LNVYFTHRHEAQVKNDRGNLPLHSAASFRAPLDVAEALLEAYPEAASLTNNYGNLALHFTAWKKGPLDVEKLLLKVYPEGAAQKNNHGNLPLHYAAHYNAPLEVVEALYNAYPEGALQKNNDNNTPLDLAIADGASPNVVALLQGHKLPPTDDELLEASKTHCERMEQEFQRAMELHGTMHEDRDVVLQVLQQLAEQQPHALYSAGLDPSAVAAADMDTMLELVRKAAAEESTAAALLPPGTSDEEMEAQLLQDALCPAEDPLERTLAQMVGLEVWKHQMRGLRRTLEVLGKSTVHATSAPTSSTSTAPRLPKHIAIVGNPGTGRTVVARATARLLHEMGAVTTRTVVECHDRDDLVDPKSEARTVLQTRRLIERAAGGVLIWNEPYTLLPSKARPRGRDHGSAALREMARALASPTAPVVIVTGAPLDLQRVLVSDIGFKGYFLTRLELPNLTPEQVARVFLAQLQHKGLVAAEGVTVQAVAELLRKNLDPDWMAERNGHLATLLLTGVRSELRKRVIWDDAALKGSLSPLKLLSGGATNSSRMPVLAPEEILVTYEDVQNAIVNGM